MTDTAASRDKLWTMIKDIKFAMFTTRHGSNGHLHSRPMTTQNKELGADDSLWFFMSRRGDPVADLAADPTVNVVYADPGADTYVSVSGTAALIDDAGKKKELWNKIAEAWFPGGADRSRPRAGSGTDRPRQLLGREVEQAGPAVRHGQGRGHRQAAGRPRRARRSAHALRQRHKVTRAIRRLADLAGERGVVRRIGFGSGRYRYGIHPWVTAMRHAPATLHFSHAFRSPPPRRRDRMGGVAVAGATGPPDAGRARQRALGRDPPRRARVGRRCRSRFAS